MQWINEYHDRLAGLGVAEEDVLFPTGPQNGMTLLVDKYIDRTVAMLSTWLTNIVEVGGGGGRPAQGPAAAVMMVRWT